MAQTDPISQMAADPDFAKMPISEQQKALAAHDPLFAKMDPVNITRFVQAHQTAAPTQPPSAFVPGDFQTMQGSPIYNPNRLGSQALPYASVPAAISGAKARAQLSDFPQQVQQAGSDAAGYAPTIGAVMGSELGLPGMAAGAGLGEIAKARMQGKPSSYKDVATTAAATYAGGKALELGGKYIANPLLKAAAGLFGESPERIAELQALPQVEEGVRQRIVQAEATSRVGFKSAYDALGIDAAPVNVASTKNIARNAAEELSKFTGVPSPLSKVGAIPEPSQNLLTSDDPATILKQLSEWDQIPFRDAQRFRSNIEQYISKSRGLPAQVYNALKQVSGAIGDGLEKTADIEGKLDDYQAANALFKQHAADFWNKTAPLKAFLNTAENSTGSTLNRFMQTATQSRALDALDRRGVPTQDLRALLSKGSQALKTDIQQAATLRNLGQPALEQQTLPARRMGALKAGLGLTGMGGAGAIGLYEGLKRH